MIGETLGGFRLTEVLGEGGQAKVYGAKGLLSRGGAIAETRDVAVKVVLRTRGDEATVFRFLRELALASCLTHPYAAALFAYGASRKLLWAAMELVRGEPLAHFTRRALLSPADAVLLLSRICEVVAVAHRRNIIHRDLKPVNILVQEGLRPKLLDFGIARDISDGPERISGVTDTSVSGVYDQLTSMSGAAIGTPGYMSPESWLTPTLADARTDIYALGIIAFELFEGRKPFTGKCAAEYMDAHLGAEMPEMERCPAFAKTLRRALSKDPADRFQDALSLATALQGDTT